MDEIQLLLQNSCQWIIKNIWVLQNSFTQQLETKQYRLHSCLIRELLISKKLFAWSTICRLLAEQRLWWTYMFSSVKP